MKRVSKIWLAGILASAVLQHAPSAYAGAEKVLHSFDVTDGAVPKGNLIELGGKLWGTTFLGGGGCDGADGCGAVFSIDPVTGSESTVHAFSYNDGMWPNGGLLNVNGTLYGITHGGGAHGVGTVFAINPTTGAVSVVHSFGDSQPDGGTPNGTLIRVKGNLYGTTSGGGNYSSGVLFAVNLATGAEKVVYSFGGHSDMYPVGGVLNVDGVFYGLARNKQGIVYKFNPKTGVQQTLLTFGIGGPGGYAPVGDLIYVNRMLYGATQYGGAHNDGVVYSLNPRTGVETVLHAFCSEENCADGVVPYAGLIESKGMLYGTTGNGGNSNCFRGLGCGTVFSIDPTRGNFKLLYSFKDTGGDASGMNASLFRMKGGLFGAATSGGTSLNCKYGCGAVFVVKP